MLSLGFKEAQGMCVAWDLAVGGHWRRYWILINKTGLGFWALWQEEQCYIHRSEKFITIIESSGKQKRPNLRESKEINKKFPLSSHSSSQRPKFPPTHQVLLWPWFSLVFPYSLGNVCLVHECFVWFYDLDNMILTLPEKQALCK